MSGNRVAFHLRGAARDDGLVRVGDFARFLESLATSLRRTQESIGAERVPVYRITSLGLGSAVVEIEAVTEAGQVDDTAERVVELFVSGLKSLQQGTRPPPELTPSTLQSFGDLVAPLKSTLAAIEVHADNEEFALTRIVEERATAYRDRGSAAAGRATGYIDAVNVHDELLFYLYPTMLPGRIACHFTSELLEAVKNSIKKYVTVEGILLYERGRIAPKRIDVRALVQHPLPNQLPTLRSLLGLAPDLTGNIDSVAYVKRIRNAQT